MPLLTDTSRALLVCLLVTLSYYLLTRPFLVVTLYPLTCIPLPLSGLDSLPPRVKQNKNPCRTYIWIHMDPWCRSLFERLAKREGNYGPWAEEGATGKSRLARTVTAKSAFRGLTSVLPNEVIVFRVHVGCVVLCVSVRRTKA